MDAKATALLADLLLFSTVNTVNAIRGFIHTARIGRPDWANLLGTIALLMALPAAACSWLYLSTQRPWYFAIGPALYAIYGVTQFTLDYVLRLEFRDPPRMPILLALAATYHIGVIWMWMLMWPVGVAFWSISAAVWVVQLVAGLMADRRIKASER